MRTAVPALGHARRQGWAGKVGQVLLITFVFVDEQSACAENATVFRTRSRRSPIEYLTGDSSFTGSEHRHFRFERIVVRVFIMTLALLPAYAKTGDVDKCSIGHTNVIRIVVRRIPHHGQA